LDGSQGIFNGGPSQIMAHFEYTPNQALQAVGGDIRKLPSDWKEALRDARELTLYRVNMDYKKFQALRQGCPYLKTLTLQQISCNGSSHFDKSAIEYFFINHEQLLETTIIGAPCIHRKKPWLAIMMARAEDCGLTKEALWTLYIELHEEAHQRGDSSIHDEETIQGSINESDEAIFKFFNDVSTAIAKIIQGLT
jgi:hypothetical protein